MVKLYYSSRQRWELNETLESQPNQVSNFYRKKVLTERKIELQEGMIDLTRLELMTP